MGNREEPADKNKNDFDYWDSIVGKTYGIVTLTHNGYVKRVSEKTFKSCGRGSRRGRDLSQQNKKSKDEVKLTLRCRTHNTLLFFSDKGNVYAEKVFNLIEFGRSGRGSPIYQIISIEATEQIISVIPMDDFYDTTFCTMATFNGLVKRIPLSDFKPVTTSGFITISLEDDDKLGWVCLTGGNDEIILVTRTGQSLRFSETEIQPTGLKAKGVVGIRAHPRDRTSALEIVKPDEYLLVVTDNGFGKLTPLSEYKKSKRGTKGVATINKRLLDALGQVTGALIVDYKSRISLISMNGFVAKITANDIPIQGLLACGSKIVNLEEGDIVVKLIKNTVWP
jgi:DNA gyrase subunit A